MNTYPARTIPGLDEPITATSAVENLLLAGAARMGAELESFDTYGTVGGRTPFNAVFLVSDHPDASDAGLVEISVQTTDPDNPEAGAALFTSYGDGSTLTGTVEAGPDAPAALRGLLDVRADEVAC